jgi:hypothetical protein
MNPSRMRIRKWKRLKPSLGYLEESGSGKVIGEITADGNRVIGYHHTDKGTPQVHWNWEDKTTGENIHLVIE